MSRIIVKNLPLKATEDDVRKHFASAGRITDVKVMRKRDGSSRRFAFVGFSGDAEAEHATQFFDMSYLNSSKLDVSLAKALGDESLAQRKLALKRKRLEQREESNGGAPTSKITRHDSRPDPPQNDKLAEFLSVMQPQQKTAMWKNDSTDVSAANGQHAPIVAPDDDETADDIVDMAPGLAKAPESATSSTETTNDVSMGDEEPEWDPTANLDDEKEDNAADTTVSDLEWLKKRQASMTDTGEKVTSATSPADDKFVADANEEEIQNEEPMVMPTNRLFLRNLAFSTTQSDIMKLFSTYGSLKQVHIPIDPKTDKPKGIAFVEFEDVEPATQALNELDGQSFQGRLLHIIFAEEQRSYVLDEFDIKNMPLKKQKALKRRMQAARQQFSWNSLYMRPDTVLEAAAAKLGITKSELMDPASSNMAVQQALAESSVLAGIQTYFRSKGVDLASFSKGASQLSDTVILAKNLPHATSAQELQDMFAQFGEVERTLMPPEGGIAIVQFKLASVGRQAFKKLAFRRIGDSILYLQKAPKGALTEPVASQEDSGAAVPAVSAKVAKSAQDMLLPATESIQDGDVDDVRTSVFVKNLNFTTTEASLTKLFQALPGYITCTIKTKPDPQTPGKKLSMGFGFVEFRSRSQADVAIKTLQNHVLDGHSLELKISSRGSDSAATKVSMNTATAKIVIKNIPFETNKQDVVDLFGTFGKLRSVRVPKKFNRQTRGFAFAEFATPKEAEHAMASLQGAHLLGRRLVMDYAQADAEDAETEISRMEAKVAKQVNAQELNSHRLGGQQKSFDMEESD